MIPILADENFPAASIDALRSAGLDISSVAEIMPGASDVAILELARSESRLLVTFDRDFGELIYRRGQSVPPGVVYLRFIPHNPDEPATVLRSLLAHSAIELERRFTVVSRDQVRQRPLP